MSEPPIFDAVANQAALFSALVRATALARGAIKKGFNNHHKFRFVDTDTMVHLTSNALTDEGLTLMPLKDEVVSVVGAAEGQLFIRRSWLLVHEGGGSILIERDWPIVPERGRPLDKATASGYTSSLNYLLRDLLMVPRFDTEDEMNANSRDVETSPAHPNPSGQGEARQPSTAPRAESAGSQGFTVRVDEVPHRAMIAEIRGWQVEIPRPPTQCPTEGCVGHVWGSAEGLAEAIAEGGLPGKPHPMYGCNQCNWVAFPPSGLCALLKQDASWTREESGRFIQGLSILGLLYKNVREPGPEYGPGSPSTWITSKRIDFLADLEAGEIPTIYSPAN
jgi:hypothetical protein